MALPAVPRLQPGVVRPAPLADEQAAQLLPVHGLLVHQPASCGCELLASGHSQSSEQRAHLLSCCRAFSMSLGSPESSSSALKLLSGSAVTTG